MHSNWNHCHVCSWELTYNCCSHACQHKTTRCTGEIIIKNSTKWKKQTVRNSFIAVKAMYTDMDGITILELDKDVLLRLRECEQSLFVNLIVPYKKRYMTRWMQQRLQRYLLDMDCVGTLTWSAIRVYGNYHTTEVCVYVTLFHPLFVEVTFVFHQGMSTTNAKRVCVFLWLLQCRTHFLFYALHEACQVRL